MSSQNKLRMRQLGQKLQLLNAVKDIQTPEKGWIHSIRTTLNMTLRQLGNKLNMSEQGAKDLENREASGAISLRSLQEAANALDMKLVYGLVPKDGTLEQLVERKARALAEKIVQRTHHTMELENQGNSEERIAAAIDDLTDEIKRELRRSIWD